MVFRPNHRLGILLVLGCASYGIGGCTSSTDDSPVTSQSSTSGGGDSRSDASEDTVSTGGKSSSKAASVTGGKLGRGGAKNSQVQQQSGGAEADPSSDSGGDTATESDASGGKSSSGGTSNDRSTAQATDTGGSRNSGAKGGVAAGGKSSSPGSSATGGKRASSSATAAGGAATGGKSASGGDTNTATGECKKGQVAAKEVIIMGESFYAMAPQYIQKRIEENAKKAGAIGSGDSYRNVAISGQPMSVVAGEFDTALKGGAVKVVIMDGGGIDCMSSSCPNCPTLFKTLLTKMASNGVQSVIYTRYPEPGNPPGSNATLKKNLDALMPEMEKVCKASTSPPCYWVDLRPVWQNGDTTDGLHPTQSGGNHCGDAIWAEMVKQCIAQ